MAGKNTRHIKEIIEPLLARWSSSKAKMAQAARKAWAEAAGREIDKHATLVNFKKGTLTVIVENAPWLYRISLERKKLLEAFNKNYTGRKKATGIRLRIGRAYE